MPERLQLVLSLYYQEDCSFREVGEVLGVTEARICQLHAEAIHRIRAYLDVSVDASSPRKPREQGMKRRRLGQRRQAPSVRSPRSTWPDAGL